MAAVVAVGLALHVVARAIVLVEPLACNKVLPAAVGAAGGPLLADLKMADLEWAHMVALAGVVATTVAAAAATSFACSSEEHLVL